MGENSKKNENKPSAFAVGVDAVVIFYRDIISLLSDWWFKKTVLNPMIKELRKKGWKI